MDNDKVPRESIDRGSDEEQQCKESSASAENATALLSTKTVAMSPTEPVLNEKGSGGGSATTEKRQMDGGFRAWLIVLSSFMCNGLIFGVINSYSPIFIELKKILEDNGVAGANGKACE